MEYTIWWFRKWYILLIINVRRFATIIFSITAFYFLVFCTSGAAVSRFIMLYLHTWLRGLAFSDNIPSQNKKNKTKHVHFQYIYLPLMGKLNLFFKICQMYINYTECIQ